ncbi:MAG: tetratricopeptide repeat protein, partial [Bdellovibrionota bacterium]
MTSFIFKSLFKISMLYIGLTSVSLAEAADPSLGTIRDNNKAVSEMAAEKAFAAEKLFIGALAHDPFRQELRFNLGNAYFLQKKYDRALKEFESVVRQTPVGQSAENDTIRFKALFNGALAA